MACSHRCVGSKNGSCTNIFHSIVAGFTCVYLFPQLFKKCKCGMPFVEMKNKIVVTKRIKDRASSNAENIFLQETMFYISNIKL